MRWIAGMACVIVLLGCGGSGGDATNPDATATRAAEQTEVASARQPTATVTASATVTRVIIQSIPAPILRTVEYVVSANPSVAVSLTFVNSTGGTEQIASEPTNWTRRLQVPPGTFVSVIAQNGTDTDASLTCQIKVNGTTLETSTSQGAFVLASCSGIVP